MGILNNSVSISQFKLIGKPPKTGFEDWIANSLKKFGFKSIDDAISEKTVGWTSVDNVHDSSFGNYSNFLRPPYVCFSLRSDERKVPQAVLKHHVDKACQNWLAEHRDLKWVPKQRKSEIKELVYNKLISKTLAVPAIHDIVWNSESNLITIATLNPKVIEVFEKLFKESFDGLGLLAVYPMLRAEMVLDPSKHGALAQYNKAGSDNVVDQIKDNLWLGNTFLLWLVYQTMESSSDYMINQSGPAPMKEPFVAHIDSKLQAFGEDEDGSKKIIFSGPQSKFKEVRSALKNNLQVTDATIYLEKDEEVYKLTLKGEMFTFSALKTPKVKIEKDDLTDEMDERESVFYERMYLLELTQQMFDSVFADFLEARLSKTWKKTAQIIRDWVQA